jgi:uncharacterized protein YggE
MSRCAFAGLFLLSAGLAFAQLDSNTVTVTASRTSNPEPDQAVFVVTVESALTTALGDVLAALQGSGITLANFSGVTTVPTILAVLQPEPSSPQPQPPILWMFTLDVPLGSTKDTVAALTRLQQSIAVGKSGLMLNFEIGRTQVSPQARQAQPCVAVDLISDARAQAQKTAASAGLTVLSVVSISGSTSICSATVTFGSATSKSMTISALQQVAVAPDQIVFGVRVNSGLSTALDEVIAALQGSGITAVNLSSVYTQTTYTSQNQQQQQYLQWTFGLPVFFGAMQDTAASLTSLQKAIAQQKSGLVLSFGPEGTRVSPQTQQAHQCSATSLIADAQAQAQKLADAAGFILGPILAISEAGLSPLQTLAVAPVSARSTIDFGGFLTQFVSPVLIPPPVPSTCSLSIKFALFGG